MNGNNKTAPPAHAKKAWAAEGHAIQGECIQIQFPKQWDLIARIKTLSGRRWVQTRFRWEAPICAENIEKLIQWGFQLCPRLNKWKESQTDMNNAPLSPLGDIPGLKCTLRPFQQDGVAFYEARDGRLLNADDMGLGKTYQTIAWLQLRAATALPALIVCPASVKYMWKDKIEELTTGITAQIVNGRKPVKVKADVVIINYDVLSVSGPCPKCNGEREKRLNCRTCRKTGRVVKVRADLRDMPFTTVIADEFHKAGNTKTQRGWAFELAAKKANHVIGLTGTPIENRIIELFPLAKMVDPTIFPNWWKFAHRYCGATHNGFGWDFTGKSNVDELHKKLRSTIMLRRQKTEVLQDLPPKQRAVVPLEIDTKLYRTRLIEAADMEAIEQYSALRKAVAECKLPACLQWIEDFLENGEKLVVFAHHRKVIDAIMEKFPEISVKVDGSVSAKGRRDAENRFQNDPECRLFAGNLQAGGVGLTLTAAATSATIEFSFKPSDHEQAEDRVWRMSQLKKSTAYYLVARDTIEEDIMKIIDGKQSTIDAVIDGAVEADENAIRQLFKKSLEKVS